MSRAEAGAGLADRNCRRLVWFRVFFNARFYYPVLAILFLDLGLSAAQYTVLNFVWALVIVFAELPAGALADRIGRRPVLIAAALCMVAEMLVLGLAPRDAGLVLFAVCLVNRVLSGLAEALASGADEALAYDALAAEGRAREWPAVLARVMQWQSLGMVLAMLAGSALYDPDLLNRAAAALGFAFGLDQGTTLRFPLVANLLTALAVLVVALGMREAAVEQRTRAPAVSSVIAAGRWIVATPLALFVIAGGLAIDSVIRVFLTFASAYYRLIGLPEASYGLIGAALAAVGVLVAPIARALVGSASVLGSYALLAALTLLGLGGVALAIPGWGVAFALPLGAAFALVGFAVSHYLNAAVSAGHRATVLSFKGLAFNLGYGFVSLLFALALRAYRDTGGVAEGLAEALAWLPLWFAFTVLLLGLGFRRHRRLLCGRG